MGGFTNSLHQCLRPLMWAKTSASSKEQAQPFQEVPVTVFLGIASPTKHVEMILLLAPWLWERNLTVTMNLGRQWIARSLWGGDGAWYMGKMSFQWLHPSTGVFWTPTVSGPPEPLPWHGNMESHQLTESHHHSSCWASTSHPLRCWHSYELLLSCRCIQIMMSSLLAKVSNDRLNGQVIAHDWHVLWHNNLTLYPHFSVSCLYRRASTWGWGVCTPNRKFTIHAEVKFKDYGLGFEWMTILARERGCSFWVIWKDFMIFICLLRMGGAGQRNLFISDSVMGDTFCQSIQMQMCLWCLYYLNIFTIWFLWVFDWGLSLVYTETPNKQLAHRMDGGSFERKWLCESKGLIWSALHTNMAL